ncbi:MAG: response regulator [Solirubrobacteraceae bacterium]
MGATSHVTAGPGSAPPVACADALNWEPRVLVVDDDEVCRVATVGLLGRLGLPADVAAGGRDALSMAAAWPYVAILMDCVMPDVDGYQATSRIRALAGSDESPPIVAVTSYSRHVSLAAGMDHHIAKPLRLEQLRADCARLGLLAPAPRAPVSGEWLSAPALRERPNLPATRASELALAFVVRARRRLPQLWRAANRGELGSISDLALKLERRAVSVGAARVAAVCDLMLDAARRGDAATAASLEPALRTALAQTAEAAPALAAPVATVVPIAASRPAAPVAPSRPPTVIRVAIADDDPLARSAIEAMIRAGDHLELVGSAAGVDELLELVARERPDVVLADFMMPDGGGAEAARRIRASFPGTRIVALTASEGPQAYLAMLRAGADGLLVKGVSLPRLVDLIHRAAARGSS